ncbi:MAG: DegT/DnrJ/EryC1/StrS family aminotransferase [Desulfomonilaceae bacterium]
MIKQVDPKASYLAHQDEIDAVINRCLNSGMYILGQEVESFEREFSDFLGARHCVSVASGTDALVLAMSACGIKRDDVVITVSHTAGATVAAVEILGAAPLLIDVDPRTYLMEADILDEAIQELQSTDPPKAERLKAIIVVHLYGCPADMYSINDVAARHGLFVIEDCAQAHGATINGAMVGTLGHVSAFSFYPTKNLGAFGDGGAVVTNDDNLAESVQLLRQYGWKDRYISQRPGYNSRLDEIQAAILRVKLKYLENDNAKRIEIAGRYSRALESVDLQLPKEIFGRQHVYHQFVIQTSNRDNFRNYLAESGISTGIHYKIPIHLQPAYSVRKLTWPDKLENTESLCDRIVSLPMHPYLTQDQVDRICDTMFQWFAKGPGRL